MRGGYVARILRERGGYVARTEGADVDEDPKEVDEQHREGRLECLNRQIERIFHVLHHVLHDPLAQY